MSQLGMGVLINMLLGNEDSYKTFEDSKGKIITKLLLDKEQDALIFEFEDKTKMKMFDDGQSCCESRWMDTDDDLSTFNGGTLLDADIRTVEAKDSEWGGVHEQQFLIISTSLGQFTMVNHNEHNGYYGGFWIVCELIPDQVASNPKP